MAERLHFHLSLSCIGEGNGNPLRCSCLENPRNGGAWRAAVYRVAQSWTRLKRLSSSSSSLQEHRKCSLESSIGKRECPSNVSVFTLKWLDVAREICVISYSLRNLYIKSVVWSLDIFRPCTHAVTSVVPNSLRPHGLTKLLCPWNLPGKNTGMVTIPFSMRSSQPRDQTWVSYVSCIGRWVLYH